MPRPRIPISVSLVAWTLLVWTTRIGNIWNDASLTDSEKWGRTGLAVSFTVLALAAVLALWRHAPWQRPVIAVLAVWTIVVWTVRSFGIATGDHTPAFTTVHLALALISMALSGLVLRPRTSASIPS